MAKKSGEEVPPVELEMYGDKFILWPQNMVIRDNPKEDLMMIEIDFDQVGGTPPDEEEDRNITCISFYKNINSRFDGADVDGLSIPDRKSAVKILRTVKEYCKRVASEELNNELDKVTVNDIYFD